MVAHLIQPYLTYCIIIWGNTFKTYLNKLHVSQKKIVRIIQHSEFNAHTKHLFKTLKIMKIYQLYDYFVGIFVFKCINKNPMHIIWSCIHTDECCKSRLIA